MPQCYVIRTVPVLLKINWNITIFETRTEFFLAEMQAQWDDGAVKYCWAITTGREGAGVVIMLWPISFRYVGVWISAGLPRTIIANLRWIYRNVTIAYGEYWLSRSHLKIVGTRMVKWSKFHTEDSKMLGTAVQNSVSREIWRSRFGRHLVQHCCAGVIMSRVLEL